MRHSPKVETVEVDGKVIGFALKADFVAEHECGVNRMKRKFQISTTTLKEHVEKKYSNILSRLFYKIPLNIDHSKNSKNPNIYIVKDKEYLYLSMPNKYDGNKKTIKDFENSYYIRESESFTGSWDESEFIIVAKNTAENLAYFEMIVDAELNNDLFIGFYPDIFKQGLLIVKYSGIPEKDILSSIESRKESILLLKKVRESKIEKIIKKNGKGFYALQPMIVGIEGFKTAYNEYTNGTLMFFLNPENQQKYSSGWYSLAEIKEWAEKDSGPVLDRKNK